MSLKNNLSILQIVNLKITDFQYFSVLFFFSFSAQNSSFQVIPPPTIGKHLLFYRNINNDTFKSNSDKFYNTKALWEATVDFPVLQTILSLVSHCIPQNTFFVTNPTSTMALSWSSCVPTCWPAKFVDRLFAVVLWFAQQTFHQEDFQWEWTLTESKKSGNLACL